VIIVVVAIDESMATTLFIFCNKEEMCIRNIADSKKLHSLRMRLFWINNELEGVLCQ